MNKNKKLFDYLLINNLLLKNDNNTLIITSLKYSDFLIQLTIFPNTGIFIKNFINNYKILCKKLDNNVIFREYILFKDINKFYKIKLDMIKNGLAPPKFARFILYSLIKLLVIENFIKKDNIIFLEASGYVNFNKNNINLLDNFSALVNMYHKMSFMDMYTIDIRKRIRMNDNLFLYKSRINFENERVVGMYTTVINFLNKYESLNINFT